MKKQVIKINPTDLAKVTVRSFGSFAWEAGKSGPMKSKVHANKKLKEPKYKNRFHELEQ